MGLCLDNDYMCSAHTNFMLSSCNSQPLEMSSPKEFSPGVSIYRSWSWDFDQQSFGFSIPVQSHVSNGAGRTVQTYALG